MMMVRILQICLYGRDKRLLVRCYPTESFYTGKVFCDGTARETTCTLSNGSTLWGHATLDGGGGEVELNDLVLTRGDIICVNSAKVWRGSEILFQTPLRSPTALGIYD